MRRLSLEEGRRSLICIKKTTSVWNLSVPDAVSEYNVSRDIRTYCSVYVCRHIPLWVWRQQVISTWPLRWKALTFEGTGQANFKPCCDLIRDRVSSVHPSGSETTASSNKTAGAFRSDRSCEISFIKWNFDAKEHIIPPRPIKPLSSLRSVHVLCYEKTHWNQ